LGAKRRQTNTPSPPRSHPGRVLLRGGVARSIVGAPPRCEAKSDQYTEPVRSHPGRVLLQGGVTRSIVGAPPRCEAKSDQYTEPVRSHPGRVLLQGGGDAFDCRSTASVRSEGKPIHRARPFAPGAGAPTGVARK